MDSCIPHLKTLKLFLSLYDSRLSGLIFNVIERPVPLPKPISLGMIIELIATASDRKNFDSSRSQRFHRRIERNTHSLPPNSLATYIHYSAQKNYILKGGFPEWRID